jgi:plasmid stabilization system protein ParE
LAVEKLEEFADYIAIDNIDSALKWTDTIRESVNKIKRFTNIGREVPKFKRTDLHEIIEGDYRIIYRVETGRISILTIRHGKQLLKKSDIT